MVVKTETVIRPQNGRITPPRDGRESLLGLTHEELARVLNQIVAYEVAHSRRVTSREHRARSWRGRLVDRLAWAVRWWL